MRIFFFTILVLVCFAVNGCSSKPGQLDTPPPADAVKGKVNAITPGDALPKVEAAYSQFVDVRTAAEYSGGHAKRAINIPQSELLENLDRLEKKEPVYLICETGRRSAESAELLTQNGFEWVFTVSGGTSAWRDAGLPMEGTEPKN